MTKNVSVWDELSGGPNEPAYQISVVVDRME